MFQGFPDSMLGPREIISWYPHPKGTSISSFPLTTYTFKKLELHKPTHKGFQYY